MIHGRELGLLLYKGGTVCDDSFTQEAADAICKQMNYAHSTGWTIGESFSIQVDANVWLVVFFKLWFVSLCRVCAPLLNCLIWFLLFKRLKYFRVIIRLPWTMWGAAVRSGRTAVSLKIATVYTVKMCFWAAIWRQRVRTVPAITLCWQKELLLPLL